MKTFDTPGMAVVIVEGDKTTTHAWGRAQARFRRAGRAHTIFPIGSNTKAFTAAALAILVTRAAEMGRPGSRSTAEDSACTTPTRRRK